MQGHRHLKTAEAARLLGLSPRTLERWRATGAGPSYRKLGRAVRYQISDLKSFAATRTRSSIADRARPADDHPGHVRAHERGATR